MGKTLTPVQAQRLEELQATTGRRIYTYDHKGQAVIDQLARYLRDENSERIGKALYDFLTMRGGFIAHYNLHGFRHVYREPAALIEEFGGYHPCAHGEVGAVYTDGMTDADVYAEVAAMLAQATARAEQGRAERQFGAALTQALLFCEQYGFALIPPGHTPIDCPVERNLAAEDETLAAWMSRLAAARGLRLVKVGEQTTLLDAAA